MNRKELSFRMRRKQNQLGLYLNAYIYLTMDAQLNIQNGTYASAKNRLKMFMKEPHTALLVAPTGVGKMHLALILLKNEFHCNNLPHSST